MYSAVGSMANIITHLRTQLSAATTGSGTATASAISSAQQMLLQMGSLMNTQYDGQYRLWRRPHRHGAGRSVRPSRPGPARLTTADTSYYKGDGEIASVRVSDDQTVSYGVTADNPAFEQVMRVLKFVANSSSLSSTDITQALDLASNALTPPRRCRLSCRARRPRSNRQARSRATTRASPRRLPATSPASTSRR